jgi:hypothetical protein
VRKAVVAHHRHDQGIPVEQASLSRDIGGQPDLGHGDRQDANPGSVDFVQGLSWPDELLHLGWVSAKAVRDSLHGPAKTVGRLDGHLPVNDISQHVRGGDGAYLLILDPVKKRIAGGPVREVIGEGENGW